LHANAAAQAEKLLERARDRFGISEVSETNISVVSPVLGVHTGPGALGIAYMAGM
jgi:fatty acid-binding protein DegV